jgi:hypothetical protein
MIFKAASKEQAAEWAAKLKKAKIHAIIVRKTPTDVHVSDDMADKASAVIHPPKPQPKPPKKDQPLSKAVAIRLARHFDGAEDITRIDPNTEAIWTAVYRITFSLGVPWDVVSDYLFACANDDTLIKGIGPGRGMQIQARYISEEIEREEYTSLSAATRISVSFSQAGKVAKKWAGNYNSSSVTDVYFYIK